MSSSTNTTNNKSGMDTVLTRHGKSLQVGQSVRFALIKGRSIVQADPVNPKAPKETFPLVAKFPESVVRPNFRTKPWATARLYQQDTPKFQDDSDEDDSAVDSKKRKKGWRRRDAPKRQWMLQPSTEFLEAMMRKRQKLPSTNTTTTTTSVRYEGYPEHSASHYALMRVARPAEGDDVDMVTHGAPAALTPNIQVQLLAPPFATQSFAQPARSNASLRDAEHKVLDSRAAVSRNISSKGRLLGKISQQEQKHQQIVEEDDDVMADVAFTNRKGGGGKARKELLSTLAEDGMKVDDDGVLGGTNDAEFGGRRHFGRFAVEKSDEKTNGSKEVTGEKDAVGYDGMAMSDDFYKRDVMAEYEDLDYDANEQFDDDDVDLGEAEVVVDPNTGFQEEEEDDEDEEELEGATGGAEGLATVAGFRALLAKARGEAPVDASDGEGEDKKDEAGGESRPASPKGAAANNLGTEEPTADGGLAQVMAAAEKSATTAKQKVTGKAKPRRSSTEGVGVDENGERLVTLDAIRREIWLHHGAIATKRLMKIFTIKKRTAPQRREKFMELVKELCTVKADPVQGNMLVLKQHYSNMG